MRMLLRTEFPGGLFGDPALYVWELNAKRAMLFDCGDLSYFTIRQLLKVSHIFLSHCHIDHFYGFDHFLRVHVGSEKTVTVMGPPETSDRVAGKLQGYTWNLVWDQNLEFVAVDLDVDAKTKSTVSFHAKNRFLPSPKKVSAWDPLTPAFETDTFCVKATCLDHRTPSIAYVIEEKMNVAINSSRLYDMGFKSGPWLNQLKSCYLNNNLDQKIDALVKGGATKSYAAKDLVQWLLVPRQRHKIGYVTDGAANEQNRKKLLDLFANTDLLFAETCFLEEDRALADETKHFTATFIAKLSEEAGVKRLFPFHFSKRYVACSDKVLDELSDYFHGDLNVRPVSDQSPA